MVGLILTGIFPIGQGKHLRLEFKEGNKNITAMKFSTSEEQFDYKIGDAIDIAFTVCVSEFRGRNSVSLFIRDMHFSALDIETLSEEKIIYENMKTNMLQKNIKHSDFAPERDDFVSIYKFLRKQKEINASKEAFYFRLNNKKLSFAKFLLAIDVMKELKLIKIKTIGEVFNIKMNKNKIQVKLEDSKILQKIKSKELASI